MTSALPVLQNDEHLYLLILTGRVSRHLGSLTGGGFAPQSRLKLGKSPSALLGPPPFGAVLAVFCCVHSGLHSGLVPILPPLFCVAGSLLSGHRRSEILNLLGAS